MSFGWNIPDCTFFDEADVKKIIAAGIQILKESVWTIDGTDEFMQALRTFECDIQGMQVRFPRSVIDRTLERIQRAKPSVVPLQNRRASTDVNCSTSGQAIYASDVETGALRIATTKDLADLSRVINAYPGLGRSHPTFLPQDAPLMTRDLHAFVTIMLHSDKPYRVSAFSPQILKYFIEAQTIYYRSREKALDQLLLPCKVWVNTPFMISRESIAAAMEIRALTGKPLVYNPMPVVGIATPVTPFGALALITAEVLGVNAISLALDDRLAGWCAAPLIFDMKNAIDALWGPEVLTICTAQTHLAASLFGGQASVRLITYTSAKHPGAQSMAERAFGLGMGFMAGIRDFGALATLANADVGSIVQLVMDMEIIGALRKMAEGFEIKPEETDVEFIVQTANRGARFLDTEHTAAHYRQHQWFPELMDRRVPGAWIKDPSDMVDMARQKALKLIATAPNRCPLEPDQKKELQRLLETADRELA